MRKFRYMEFNGEDSREVVLTEKEVLDYYFDYWAEGMWKSSRDPMDINEEECLMDWMLTH